VYFLIFSNPPSPARPLGSLLLFTSKNPADHTSQPLPISPQFSSTQHDNLNFQLLFSLFVFFLKQSEEQRRIADINQRKNWEFELVNQYLSFDLRNKSKTITYKLNGC
jgi:hypothetical protein